MYIFLHFKISISFVSTQNVFPHFTKCISPFCELYFAISRNVFQHFTECTFPFHGMYFCISRNVFRLPRPHRESALRFCSFSGVNGWGSNAQNGEAGNCDVPQDCEVIRTAVPGADFKPENPLAKTFYCKHGKARGNGIICSCDPECGDSGYNGTNCDQMLPCANKTRANITKPNEFFCLGGTLRRKDAAVGPECECVCNPQFGWQGPNCDIKKKCERSANASNLNRDPV
jgi:hypothetical protein